MELDILHSTVRIATPLIFAALGGLLTYQAGMLNIALDGFMIVAAFFGIAAAYYSGSLVIAILAAVAASVLLAALMALFNIRFRAHIFIVGIAVTYLAYGLTALLLKGMFGQDALFTADTIPTFPEIDIPIIDRIPVLGQVLSGHTILVYCAYLLVPIVSWALYRTRWGLRLRVVGEAPEAAATAGINVDRVKFQAMLLSGAFCGLGGAYLSLAYVTLFSKEMTNERGLIALAAIFFARGNPYFTALVALIFGAATALSVTLPQSTGIASQLLQMIPYVVTVLALVLVGWRATRTRNKYRAWRFDLS
jgi:simple sugar transport system permease protein